MSLANVSEFEYTGKSFDVSSQDPYLRHMTFKPDGTKMYTTTGDDQYVWQYSLSTAWDVSTASYDSKYLDVSSETLNARCSQFNSDGTIMFMGERYSSNVYQYSLTTGWDISTASYDEEYLETSNYCSMVLNSDGTRMFVLTNDANDPVKQYNLSSGWDISTASYASKSLEVTGQDTQPNGIGISSDGKKVFIVGTSEDTVFQYSLTTAWDISTGSYDSIYLDVSSECSGAYGLIIGNDDKSFYVADYSEHKVFQYNQVGAEIGVKYPLPAFKSS
jgi:sugar lactone lactonase YvrE